MKISRLTRVLAIVLVISMLPIGLLGCKSTTSRISDRLVEMMIGDGRLDDDNPQTKEYLARLDADVTNLRLYFDTDAGAWAYEYMTPGSSYNGVFYENLYKMTVAYFTKKSEHYHDGKLLKMVKSGLNYLYENPDGPMHSEEASHFDEYITKRERCDEAEYLVRTLLILKEKGKLGKTKRENYAEAIEFDMPNAYGTGVTLARSAYIVIAHSALTKNEDKLADTIAKLSLAACNVTNGAGLYTDGSFVEDKEIASSGSYGVVAFSELVEIAYAVQGRACDFNKELQIPAYLYNWAMNSVAPSLYNGRAFAGTVSSYIADAEYMGGRAVSSMLALAEYFEEIEDNEKANELRSIVKGYVEANGSDCYKYLTTFGATKLEDVMKEKDIKAKSVEGAYSFAATDKLNILGPVYSASLSMSSKRTAKYETRADRFDSEMINNKYMYGAVNGEAWYTGDGMLLLYTADYAPDSNYWKYVNGLRIPGTTIASINRTDKPHDGSDGVRTEAGSVTQGNFAVSSMFAITNNTEYLSTINAKKSWFFFDGEIIALGAGIKNSGDRFGASDYSIETVVENIHYGTFDSLGTGVDQKGDVKLADGREDAAVTDALYALGYGGIYVPAEKNDPLKYTLNKTDGGNFVELWLDHNDDDDSPDVFSGKTYEYVIVPSTAMNIQGFYSYVQQQKEQGASYQVLANDENVQAVRDGSTGVVGYTFWKGYSLNGISTNFACSMIINETATSITVSIADFTHTSSINAGVINLGIAGGAVASASAGLSFANGVITVDRGVASNGQTLTIVINK